MIGPHYYLCLSNLFCKCQTSLSIGMPKSPRIDAVFCSFYYLCCEKYAVCCIIYLFFFSYLCGEKYAIFCTCIPIHFHVCHIATHPIYNSFSFSFFNKPISLKTKQNKKSTILPRRFQKRRRQITFITREIYFKSNNIFRSKMNGWI